jgi:hypothetical protein
VSYVRMGKDSDVYLIGTIVDGTNVIQCCGCLLTPMGPYPRDEAELPIWARGLEWYIEDFPAFMTIAGVTAHLDEHRSHQHKVPDYAYTAIQEDDWL